MQLASSSAATTSIEDAQLCSSRGRPTSTAFDHQDALLGMEDQVCAGIADRLRQAPTGVLPMIDDESYADDVALVQVRRKPKGVSCRLFMAEPTVML